MCESQGEYVNEKRYEKRMHGKGDDDGRKGTIIIGNRTGKVREYAL